MTLKAISRLVRKSSAHWVGDGFPVRNLMSVQREGARISPFLLLDYAGPQRFEPTHKPRGVGQHPHRGFETVTLVYQGSLEHRDSAGNHGAISAGDVQWMTAASGVLHEEYHSPEFTRVGGVFEAVQLWVNLPARNKMDPPRYQTLLNDQIPVVELPGGTGQLRVIAGEYDGQAGPALTCSPLNVWDLKLRSGHRLDFDLRAGHMTAVVVLHGQARFNNAETLAEAQVVHFAREGERIEIEALQDARLLLLSGEPIDEPIASYGPFVMNTSQQIEQAINDYQNGRMGALYV